MLMIFLLCVHIFMLIPCAKLIILYTERYGHGEKYKLKTN